MEESLRKQYSKLSSFLRCHGAHVIRLLTTRLLVFPSLLELAVIWHICRQCEGSERSYTRWMTVYLGFVLTET